MPNIDKGGLALAAGLLAFAALVPSVGRAEEPALDTLPMADTAEAAEQPSNVEAVAPTPKGLDEIVVTAQKRAESVQDVPISMSAIDSEFIKDVSIGDLNELSLYVPNLKIGASPTAASIYIRGLGSGGNRGFEQSVGLFVDGIYFGRINYLTDGMVDLDRVEVLRGPQGTLFGKNTVAGALSMWTGAPSDDWIGNGDILFGEYDHMRLKAMISGPVIEDAIAFRVAGMRERRDGLIENRMTGIAGANIDKTVLRGKLRVDLNEDIEATLGVEISAVDQHGPGFQLIKWSDNTATLYKSFDARTEANGADNKTTEDFQGYSYRNSEGGNLQVNWALGEYDLVSISGYSQFAHNVNFDADFGPAPLLTTENDDAFKQFNQEIRLASPAWEKIDFLVGAYFYWSEWQVFNDTPVLTAPVTDTALSLLLPEFLGSVIGGVNPAALPTVYADRQYTTFNQYTRSYAVFGQGTWRFTEDLALVVGLRAAYEEKDALVKKEFETGLVFAYAVGNEAYAAEVERTETNVAPKVSIKYDFDEDIMAYATYGQGYKAGGFNPTAGHPDQIEFDAEKATTYEVGLKTKLFSSTAIINVGLFYTDFEDLQTSSYDGSNWIVSNAAEAVTKGIELEAHWMPFEALRITGGLGYTRARFANYRSAPCYVGEEATDGACDKTGMRMPGAPELSGSLSANLGLPLGNLPMLLVLGGDVMYQSEIFLDGDLDPNLESDAATRFNVRLGIADIERAWTFMVNVKNLTDELVLAGGTDVPLQSGSYLGGYFAPRLITAEFRAEF